MPVAVPLPSCQHHRAQLPAPSTSARCNARPLRLPSSPHSTRPPPFLPRYRRGVRQRSMDRSTERRHRLLPNNNLAVRFVLSAVLTSRSTTSESSNMSIGGRRRSLLRTSESSPSNSPVTRSLKSIPGPTELRASAKRAGISTRTNPAQSDGSFQARCVHEQLYE